MTITVNEVNGPAGAFKTFGDLGIGVGFKIGEIFFFKVSASHACGFRPEATLEQIEQGQGVVEAASVTINADY